MNFAGQLGNKLAIAVFAALCFLVVYWWRRRTRPVKLDLSTGSQKLSQLVEKSDRPETEDVLHILARILKLK